MLYYTVEFRPDLLDDPEEPEWDGSYRGLQDIQSTNPVITVPVGMMFRVSASAMPQHTRMLSPAHDTVAAGYYEPTLLREVDEDLQPHNILWGVDIFGITGTYSNNCTAFIPRTGQTVSYTPEDDGEIQYGTTGPTPRFTVATNDTDEVVTDHLTGLMWVKAPRSLPDNDIVNAWTWSNAVAYCRNLEYAGHSDWRLPNIRELLSLIDFGQTDFALPVQHPFSGLFASHYWSSTTRKDDPTLAWNIRPQYGFMGSNSKGNLMNLWPVRGGY
ncbi:MAG TPA: DUF1566 domain-containing protein [Kiritimatiellia bacterium]|nr:DUF1566 domain-containing protein [Kiritimatiellia bacterium]HMO97767.1 DUF1566 domain-containing protein [Kiritimatiellia bacterium]HMP95406.1 DUF1566 domain-containing protein [Kiritimatiellia bacterium]